MTYIDCFIQQEVMIVVGLQKHLIKFIIIALIKTLGNEFAIVSIVSKFKSMKICNPPLCILMTYAYCGGFSF